MKKYVVLSVNENPKYLFYTPLVCWAWARIGWHPIVFCSGPVDARLGFICDFTIDHKIPMLPAMVNVPEYPSDTIAQVSRLYGSCVYGVKGEDYLMTSDIDMLPLSNYWHVSELRITSWGHNLSDEHYPIAYIGMTTSLWRSVMRTEGYDYNSEIKNDLMFKQFQPLKWTTDQDIITRRIDMTAAPLNLIDRPVDKRTGYPIGRVDRSAWHLNHDQFIDAHLPHDILTNEKSYKNVMELLHHVWPAEDFKWFEDYYREFKKLL